MGKYNLQTTESQQSQSLPYHQLLHPSHHIHQQLNAQSILAMATQSPNQLSLSPSQLHHLQQQQSKNVSYQQYQLQQQQKQPQSVRSQLVCHKSTSHSTSPSSSTQSSPTIAEQTNTIAESSQTIHCNDESTTKKQAHSETNENSSLSSVANDSTIESTTNTGTITSSINNNISVDTTETPQTQLTSIDCTDNDSTNEFNKVLIHTRHSLLFLFMNTFY